MTPSQGHTVRVTRVFDAPRQTVFDYFTIPDLVKTWWGPEGVTTEEVEIDLRVGGVCRWGMRQPDGALHVTLGEFLEIAVPERLVLTQTVPGMEAVMTLTIIFVDLDGQTEVQLIHAGIAGPPLVHILETGWVSTFACLERAIQKI
ncbi:MAG: SRPBCC domain-containing protein [Chloroflexota bacterium]